jgi:hypothetical protein
MKVLSTTCGFAIMFEEEYELNKTIADLTKMRVNFKDSDASFPLLYIVTAEGTSEDLVSEEVCRNIQPKDQMEFVEDSEPGPDAFIKNKDFSKIKN